MASISPPVCDFGWKAPDFNLPGVDGRNWTLADARGPKGLLGYTLTGSAKAAFTVRIRTGRRPLGELS